MNLKIFRICWNVFLSLITFFVAIFYPFNLIFQVWDYSHFYLLDILISVFFLIDLFLREMLERNWDWHHYSESFKDKRGKIRLDLIPEILAAIPYLVFTGNTLFLLLRLMKLFKVGSMIHQLRHWMVRMSSQLTIAIFFLWLALLAHWLACGWTLLRGFDQSLDLETNYVNSLFWAVTTLTTVGYGNQLAITNTQKLFTIFAELLGVVVYGYLVGNIVSIFAKSDPAKTRFIENMEKLSVLTKLRDIPADIEMRIRNYYIYTWKKKLGYDESEIVSGLPAGLKREVSLQLKKEIVEKIPLFKNTDEHFLMDISLVLKPCIAIPGEYVVKENDSGNEMFFVLNGELTLSKEGKEYFKIFRDGDFFGEMILFSNESRTASVKAETYCDLYSLDKISFDMVISKYPDFFEKIKKQALLRNETISFIDNNI